MISGISHCHKNDVMHRDIKLENLVFKDKDCKTLKIIDFGYGQEGVMCVSGIRGSP